MHQETEKRKFTKNRAITTIKHFFDCGVLSCKPSTSFKNFRWPVKTVKLRERQKNRKI